jgi:hypothetical protein
VAAVSVKSSTADHGNDLPGLFETVVWYPNGNRNNQPRPALVTGHLPNGRLRLVVHNYLPSHLSHEVRMHVGHVATEESKQHRELNGCWEHIGGKCPV